MKAVDSERMSEYIAALLDYFADDMEKVVRCEKCVHAEESRDRENVRCDWFDYYVPKNGYCNEGREK